MNLHLNLLGLEPINTLYVLFRCPLSPGLWSCCEQSPFSNALPLRFGDKNDAYIFDFFFFFLVFVFWTWFDHYFLIYSFLTILLCTWPHHHTHTHTSTLYSLQQKFCLTTIYPSHHAKQAFSYIWASLSPFENKASDTGYKSLLSCKPSISISVIMYANFIFSFSPHFFIFWKSFFPLL